MRSLVSVYSQGKMGNSNFFTFMLRHIETEAAYIKINGKRLLKETKNRFP
jgi:hypothetical protein